MKKYYRKILYFIFAMLFGVFLFVFGEYDDSPGGQLIGLIVFIIGIVGLVKNKKTFNLITIFIFLKGVSVKITR